ncbi:MAG TPA: carboxypeptidase-like regulatory domain-containing protein [Frateuria sp.]|uniref:carboxypeptidase-like regulatory domain-containing protein n=1 Tax=Frateuria sp. TaxID=2211372 RepID=UPI002DF2CE5D|nr:carboxypeptidase-like regulatory domain-containing protein [Frateuria sp.]
MNASFSTHAGAPRRAALRKLALVAAVVACGTAVSAAALADEQTTGRVFGNAPAGSSVVIRSDFGIRREVPVDAAGRYMANWLPVGVYTVTAMANGKALVEHQGVPILVDRGSRVDFACTLGRCSEMAQR